MLFGTRVPVTLSSSARSPTLVRGNGRVGQRMCLSTREFTTRKVLERLKDFSRKCSMRYMSFSHPLISSPIVDVVSSWHGASSLDRIVEVTCGILVGKVSEMMNVPLDPI